MNYQQTIDELTEEILGVWDAAEDHGETELIETLGIASKLGRSELARQIMEGTVEIVFEQLLHNPDANELLEKIIKYRSLVRQ
jgi:hypothetical protein